MDIKPDINKYYDYTLPFYRVFWHGKTYGIHYGIWDKNTKNLNEAILNTNAFLAEKAKIRPADKVLDAGCGVGGSSLWIAKNIGAKVVGITLSKKQLEKAKGLAKRFYLDKLAEFYENDFINTGFENESFDVIWAIESVCHTQNKSDFLKEARRLLKKEGRIIIADGYLENYPKDKYEKEKLKSFLEGLVVPNLSTVRQFKESMKIVGFKNIQVWDKTNEIMPSALKIYKMSLWSYPLSKITQKLGLILEILTKNNKAGIDQLFLFKNRIITYQIFYGEK